MASYTVIHEKADAFYDTFERKAELQHQTHYCPGCGHGIVSQTAGAGHRRTGHAGPHGADQPGGLLGLRLLLFRRGQRAGGARARPGRGHGGEAQPAGEHRDRLPGRWRPGGHRHGGDHPCRQSRRTHHRDLRQQRHLRDDRRPDGAHHPARQEDHHLPARARRAQRRLPAARLRDVEFAGSAGLSSSAWPWATTSRSCTPPRWSSAPWRTRSRAWDSLSWKCSRPAPPSGKCSRWKRSASCRTRWPRVFGLCNLRDRTKDAQARPHGRRSPGAGGSAAAPRPGERRGR